MTYSRVLFVGLGGAGQRHLRILKSLLPHAEMLAYRSRGRTPLLRPDFTPDTSRSIEDAYQLRSFASLDAAFAAKPDLTVIATPTARHREPLMQAVQAGSGILVEKPWAESSHGFREFAQAGLERHVPFIISFQRRYHPLIVRAQSLLSSGAIGRPMMASFAVCSQVPAWHPYEDWRELYAVRPDLGGGVLRTEIHEIDLAYWFFGLPERVFCVGGNRAEELLDVEDTTQLTLVYPGFSTQISLTFMAGSTSRGFDIVGTQGRLTWDAREDVLVIEGRDRIAERIRLDRTSNDDMFIAQATKFVAHWTRHDSIASLCAAGASLAIVEAAELSMASGRAEPVARNVIAALEAR